MIAMSERRGFDEEVTRDTGTADSEEAAPPKALALRLIPIDALAAVEGATNEELEAAAGGPLLAFATPIPLRALRSPRDNVLAGRTDKFFEREMFGDIAIEDSSDSNTPDVCVCACGPRKLSVWAR